MRFTVEHKYKPEKEKNVPIVHIPDVHRARPDLNAYLGEITKGAVPDRYCEVKTLLNGGIVYIFLFGDSMFQSKYPDHHHHDIAFKPKEGIWGRLNPHPHPFDAHQIVSRLDGMLNPEQLDRELKQYIGQAVVLNVESMPLPPSHHRLSAYLALLPVNGAYTYTHGMISLHGAKMMPPVEQMRRRYHGSIYIEEDVAFLPPDPLSISKGYLHWREYNEKIVLMPDRDGQSEGELFPRTGYGTEIVARDNRPLNPKEFGQLLDLAESRIIEALLS
jgi:hypothetical protein